MVLVCLGTQDLPFVRLVQLVEDAIRDNVITEDVMVQIGYTKYESDAFEQFSFCSNEDMETLIAKASYVITHAGTGTIVTALKLGKKVIAVNRLKKYGEHTDDHQIEIIQEFAQTGYIIPCFDKDDLKDKIKLLDDFQPPVFISNTNTILTFLSNYIDGVIQKSKKQQ